MNIRRPRDRARHHFIDCATTGALIRHAGRRLEADSVRFEDPPSLSRRGALAGSLALLLDSPFAPPHDNARMASRKTIRIRRSDQRVMAAQRCASCSIYPHAAWLLPSRRLLFAALFVDARCRAPLCWPGAAVKLVAVLRPRRAALERLCISSSSWTHASSGLKAITKRS